MKLIPNPNSGEQSPPFNSLEMTEVDLQGLLLGLELRQDGVDQGRGFMPEIPKESWFLGKLVELSTDEISPNGHGDVPVYHVDFETPDEVAESTFIVTALAHQLMRNGIANGDPDRVSLGKQFKHAEGMSYWQGKLPELHKIGMI